MSTEMEHTNEQNLYTERYLLGGLTADEKAAFEEHFFNCTACGADVVAAARMFAAGRRVVRAEARAPAPNVIRPDPPAWRRWFPATAAASLLSAFLGWFGAVQQMAPRAVTAAKPPAIELAASEIEIDTSDERGPGDTTPPLSTSDGPGVVNVNIPPHDDAESYFLTVRNGAGQTAFSRAISRPQAENYLKLVVPRDLPRGNYHIVIEGVRKGGIRFPITEEPFTVGER